MKYNVISIFPFERQLKRLSKKYHSLKEEFSEILDTLEINPKTGVLIK